MVEASSRHKDGIAEPAKETCKICDFGPIRVSYLYVPTVIMGKDSTLLLSADEPATQTQEPQYIK